LPRRRKRTSTACTICRHEHRTLIESTRLAGASLDTIAAKYSVSRDAVHRHMHAHVSDDLRAELLAAVPLEQLAAEAAREGLTVLQYLSLTRGILVKQLQLASSVNDHHATAALAGRLNETNRLIGVITGEMGDLAARNINITATNNVSFVNSPVFADLQQMLIRRLAGHPEAMAAVVEGLRELENRSAPQPMAPLVIEHREPAHA